MSVYELTSPEGEKYQVTAPDGATEEQVMSYFMANREATPQMVADPVNPPPTQLTPQQEFANEHPILRTLGRTGRAATAGLSSLADLGLLVPKTAALGVGMALENMGAPEVGTALQRLGATPTMADTSRNIVDQATGGKLQPTGTMDKAFDFAGEMIASAVPFSRGADTVQAFGKKAPPTMGTALQAFADPETALNQLPKVQAQQANVSALRAIAPRPGVSMLEKDPENLKRLARGAAQYPSGSKVAEKYFENKLGASPDRIKTAFSKLISSNTDYYQSLDDIVKSGQEEVAPLYREAFQSNKSVASPLINRILQTPRGQAALSDAVDQMGDQMALVGVPDKELGEVARELSSMGKMDYPTGGVASGLKLETLDKIKKGFDATIRKAKEAGNREEVSRINNLRKQFVSEIDRLDATGLYSKARAKAGDYLSNEAAADAGTQIFKADKELLLKQVSDMAPAERKSFKLGVAKAMRDAVDNLADGRNPYTKTFGNSAIREKLAAVLSKDEFARLEKTMDSENELYKLKNFVLGGSPTMGKAVDAAQFSSEMADTAQQAIQSGWKSVALDKVANFVRGIATGMSDQKAKQVAEILFEEDPKKKVATLQQLLKTKDGPKDVANAYFKIQDAVSKINKVKPPSSALLTNQGALAAIAGTNTAGQKMLAPPPLKITVRPNSARGY